MSDEQNRQDERAAAQGDPDAEARRARGLCRAGHCACAAELAEARTALVTLRALESAGLFEHHQTRWPFHADPREVHPIHRPRRIPPGVHRELRRIAFIANASRDGITHAEVDAFARNLHAQEMRLVFWLVGGRWEFEVIPAGAFVTPWPTAEAPPVPRLGGRTRPRPSARFIDDLRAAFEADPPIGLSHTDLGPED